ncbi:MAG: hypothetical protein U0412_09760 [Nitrospira sp.]
MNGDLPHEDREFVAHARRLLDRTAADVDQATALRLQRARLAAVTSSPRRTAWRPWAVGVVAASLAAVGVFLWLQQPAPQQHTAVLLDDFELVTSEENVELAEDLEFYHWLADDDQAG